MKNTQKFWPILIILSIWFIFSSPYFIKGLVPFPSKYQVNFVPPWSSYQKFWGPVKNNAMPDIIGQVYPWRYLAIQIWKTGQIPFWNPYSFAGNPHLASYQPAVFSPFNILFFILPFIDAWSFIVLLQPLLAGFFMFILMKELKISNTGSLLSSVAFMFCGFVIVWMAYGTLAMAIVFLPLSIYAIEKSFHKTKIFNFIILSMSIPFSFFAGHFQTSLYYFVSILLFFLFKIIQTKNLKKAKIVFFSILVGFILSLPQILPSIQLYLYSVRSEIFIKEGGIPWFYLVNIFSPDFFGNPVTRNDWFGFYAEWASFIGIIPFVFVFFGLMTKKKISIFFLILTILTIILAVDSPLQKIIGGLKIPVLSTSEPSRIIVLLSFSFAVLSGFGIDVFFEFMRKGKYRHIFLVFLSFSLLFISIWISLILVKILPSDKLIIAKRNLLLPTILLGSAILITTVNFFIRKRTIFILSIFIIIMMSCFDSLRFAQKWMPFDPKNLVFPSVPIINEIKKYLGEGRYFGNLGDQVDGYYGFSSIEGYNPLYPQHFGEFIRSANTGDFLEAERSLVRLDRRGKYANRVLDLLGVTLIFHPRADTNQEWAFPVWEDQKRFSLIFQDDKFQLFRNNYALPRVNLFYDFEVIEQQKKIIQRFYSDDFDFRKKVILEERIDKLDKGNGQAKIIEYTPNRIVIKAKTNTPALLFLSDNYYHGWKAKINGKIIKIYRANYTFRAVIIPKGESIIEFNYSAWFF